MNRRGRSSDDAPRARCSSCGRWPTLTTAGRLRRHRTRPGGPWCESCPGHPLTAGQLELELDPPAR